MCVCEKRQTHMHKSTTALTNREKIKCLQRQKIWRLSPMNHLLFIFKSITVAETACKDWITDHVSSPLWYTHSQTCIQVEILANTWIHSQGYNTMSQCFLYNDGWNTIPSFTFKEQCICTHTCTDTHKCAHIYNCSSHMIWWLYK